jgi:outer membrane immunogenic protein
MHTMRRGIVTLAVLAIFGLSVTAAVADGSGPGPRIGSADYYELPSIWSGLYGGVNLGYADRDHDNGFVGGVQLGYNWQARQIVYGVEGDLSLSGANSVDWLASVRGRVGYLIDPRLLVYGTAGLGLVNDHGTDAGFVYGLGIEGKLNPTMSARLEYLSFNSDSVHGDVGVIRAGLNIKLAP